MSVQALTQVDPTQFFNLPSTNGTGHPAIGYPDQRDSDLPNDFSGRPSVTAGEGDKSPTRRILDPTFM